MLTRDTKSGGYKRMKSTMLTNNRSKSDISSLSTVSIFKAIKSDPRRARSRTVAATTADCTRDLHGASLRSYVHRVSGGRVEWIAVCTAKCGKVIAPALETRPNERSPERAGWKHGPLIEGNGIVRTRIPNTSARTVPGSDKSRHSTTYNETRSHHRRMIVDTKLRRAVISAARAKIENDTIKFNALGYASFLFSCFVRSYCIRTTWNFLVIHFKHIFIFDEIISL